MIVLIINAGSSSLKYQLINMLNAFNNDVDTYDVNAGKNLNIQQNHIVMASGVVERIGEPLGKIIHKKMLGKENLKFVREQEIHDHALALHLAAGMLTDNDSGSGVIKTIDEIDAIGHRVVQGGENFKSSILINDAVKQAIRDNFPLAPLHNPPNLTGIEVAESLFPSIPNIAVFDTEFHQTIPQKAFMYGLPYEFYEKFKVRRYGFHGTSHKFVANTVTELINRDKKQLTINRDRKQKLSEEEVNTNQSPSQRKIDDLNLITVHLGNGCSICAIKKGRCVDTSMGMTPLAGVMMGTRTGDIDPAIQKYLIEYTGFNAQELDNIFNKKSGLKGICGLNDMRDIHAAIKSGDERAKLALEMFCYQIKKYIGAYFAVLGHVDAIVFTAGIGENDNITREMICSNLKSLGVILDHNLNELSISEPRAIHSKISNVEIWVVPTNEELQIAREVVNVLRVHVG
ncbi:MAG: acetate kinase [Desulfamplus sp.]|nr:acetate kinase [Desulfamplus sp.]